MIIEQLLKRFNEAEIEQYECIRAVLNDVEPKTILEIGTGWGNSGCNFLFNTKAHIFSIDKIEVLSQFNEAILLCNAQDEFKERFVRITGDSSKIVPGINMNFDLIYIDGDHTYEGVRKDLDSIKHVIKDKVTLLFDDFTHKHNEDGIYGISKAVNEFIIDNKKSIKSTTLYKKAHGMFRIDYED